MNIWRSRLLPTAFIILCCLSHAYGVTEQSPTDVLADGSAYLWLEGEDAYELGGGNPVDATTGFILVDNVDPFQTITMLPDGSEVVKGGLDVLPANTNASGGAGIFQALEGGGTAKWQVKFATPATYYLYMHWSMYNRDINMNYGNEDSFYVPPAFNKNSSTDWIDFEGVDEFGEPKTGDGSRDGYIDGFPSIAQNYVSAGTVEAHNDTNEDFYDGQFHWYWLNRANDMNADGGFVSFSGHGIRYEVKEADVGTVLDFEISTREPYGAIDGFLFSTSPDLLMTYTQEQLDQFFLTGQMNVPGDFDGSGGLNVADVNLLNGVIAATTNEARFDLNADNLVNGTDLTVWVKTLRKTWFGDANLDGEFNSSDLVVVFTAGKYEQNISATWDEGDWNADLRFDSGDMVAAFTEGGYEKGPLAASPVPEPSGWMLHIIGAMLMAMWRSGWRQSKPH